MSEFKEAAELVAQQARHYAAVLKLAAIVNKIGDVERHLAEKVAAVAKAAEEHAGLTAEIESAKAQLADAIKEREQAGLEALAQARTDAAALVDKAKADAAEIARNIEEQAKAADALLAAKRKEHADVKAQHDTAKVTLGETEAKLAQAKEAVRKLLGGDA